MFMLLRNLFNTVFSSPVIAISSLVSVASIVLLSMHIFSSDTVETSSQDAVILQDTRSGITSESTLPTTSSSEQSRSGSDFSYDSTRYEPTDGSAATATNLPVSTSTDYPHYVDEQRSTLPAHTYRANQTDNPTRFYQTGSATQDKPGSISSQPDSVPTESTQTPDTAFTDSIETVVKIDLDETQTISCHRVTTNGPACMCILTTEDENGVTVEEMNNCTP